jgi:hypothetical protein
MEHLRAAERLTGVGIAASRAGYGSSALLRLPEIKRGSVVSFPEIVGDADCLCPIASLAVTCTTLIC